MKRSRPASSMPTTMKSRAMAAQSLFSTNDLETDHKLIIFLISVNTTLPDGEHDWSNVTLVQLIYLLKEKEDWALGNRNIEIGKKNTLTTIPTSRRIYMICPVSSVGERATRIACPRTSILTSTPPRALATYEKASSISA